MFVIHKKKIYICELCSLSKHMMSKLHVRVFLVFVMSHMLMSHVDRKKPPPLGGFPIYYVPSSRTVSKRTPLEVPGGSGGTPKSICKDLQSCNKAHGCIFKKCTYFQKKKKRQIFFFAIFFANVARNAILTRLGVNLVTQFARKSV